MKRNPILFITFFILISCKKELRANSTTISELSNSKEQLQLNGDTILYGYEQGKDMTPEFILIRDSEKYYIITEWINNDVLTKPKKQGYEIEKIE